MLEVITEQGRATGILGRRDDQGVIDGQIVVSRQNDRARMNRHAQRRNWPEQVLNHRKRGFDLIPRPAELASGDIHELVEHLNTDDTPPCNELLGFDAAWIVLGKSVDKNIGIEELSITHIVGGHQEAEFDIRES